MIDNITEMIVQGTEREPIDHWEVQFFTNEGGFSTLAEAHASCMRTMQHSSTIMPLPVAVGKTLSEVCLKQTMLIGGQNG